MVFLSFIRAALTGEAFCYKFKRCIVHPIKKRPAAEPNESLIYCANINVILSYHKVKDDINDNRGLRKLGGVFLLSAAGIMKKKADDFIELDTVIKNHIDILNEREKRRDITLDGGADIFGGLLAAVFEYGLPDEFSARVAHEIGFHIGRWIYITDAFDDYEKDKKTGAFNPLLNCGVDVKEEPDKLNEMLRHASVMELSQAEKAVNLIEFKDKSIENIVKNIIYLGMVNCTEKIYTEKKERK